jgi:hypothetical protein
MYVRQYYWDSMRAEMKRRGVYVPGMSRSSSSRSLIDDQELAIVKGKSLSYAGGSEPDLDSPVSRTSAISIVDDTPMLLVALASRQVASAARSRRQQGGK